MANIPLSDIPNAPQQVFSPTADPRFGGDQVGNEAKQQIREGYGSLMQDPARAGAIGAAVMNLGESITKAGDGIGEAIGMDQVGKQRQAMEAARDSGFLKLSQNKIGIENQFNQLSAGQPVANYPMIWDKLVGGAEGTTFYSGVNGSNPMTPLEQAVMTHHVMEASYTGMAHYTGAAHAIDLQNQAASATALYNSQINKGDLDGAAQTSVSMTALGFQNKGQEIANNQNISAARDAQLFTKSLVDHSTAFLNGKATDPTPPALRTMQDYAARGQGMGNMDAAQVMKQAKIGEAVVNQQLWGMVGNVQNAIYSDTYKSSDALEKAFPYIKNLPEAQKTAVFNTYNNLREGTALGTAATKEAQHMVDEFPKTDSSNSEELLNAKTFIGQNVPNSQQKDLIAQLDKKQRERIDNGGNLKPESQLKQYAAEKVGALLKGQTFGKYDPYMINNPKGNKITQEKLQPTLDALARAEDIKRLVERSGETTQKGIDKVIDDATKTYRAADAAKKVHHWWNF